MIIGHRGAPGVAPENTLAGFARAVGYGADGVEFDVRMAGSQVVVIHDERVDRTTDGTGRVDELSFAELRRLDAGAGQHIPTLEEALDAIPRHVMVNVELKGPGTAEPVAGVVSHRAAVPTGTGLPALLVSSFDYDELGRFHAVRPDIPCAPLAKRFCQGLEQTAKALDAWSVNLAERGATGANVAAIRSWERRCLVYTVNDPGKAREFHAMGATGVFTDYPDRLVSAASGSRFSSSASSRCSS